MKKPKSRNQYKRKVGQYKLFGFARYRSRNPLVESYIANMESKFVASGSKTERRQLKSKSVTVLYFRTKLGIDQALRGVIHWNKVALKVDTTLHLDHILNEFEARCIHRGTGDALKFFKELYGAACKIACSSYFEPIAFTKCNSSGEPIILGPLLGLLHGTLEERKSALSVLQVFKLVPYWGTDYGLDTITQEPAQPKYSGLRRTGKYFEGCRMRVDPKKAKLLEEAIKAFREVVNEMFPREQLSNRRRELYQLNACHFSGRNGPNGPALSTAVADMEALLQPESKDLFNSIYQMCQLTGNSDLLSQIEGITGSEYTLRCSKPLPKVPIHSKISLKREPWGRLRPFAICDYFSHSSLKGVHRYLYRYLELLAEDGTHDQEKVSELVRKLTTPGSPYSNESVDLSAATDSIPVEIQAEIITAMFGTDISACWETIASARSFKGPNGETVTYTVGQPMGLLSSWASLAVWHHAIVRTCYKLQGLDHSQRYCIIGDDVWMTGATTKNLYRFLVADLMGVGISRSKGFYSEDQTEVNALLPNPSSAELAKRIFHCGYEVTPIPPDEVLEFIFHPARGTTGVLADLVKRNYPVSYTRETFHELLDVSYDPNKALLMSSFPLRPSLITEGMEFTGDECIWYTPDFQQFDLNRQLVRIIREDMITTATRTQFTIREWTNLCMSGEEIRAGSWVYTCPGQVEILFYAAMAAQQQSDRALMELNTMPHNAENPEYWRTIHRISGLFNTLFEVDYALRGRHPQQRTRYSYSETLIDRLLKQLSDLKANSGQV